MNDIDFRERALDHIFSMMNNAVRYGEPSESTVSGIISCIIFCSGIGLINPDEMVELINEFECIRAERISNLQSMFQTDFPSSSQDVDDWINNLYNKNKFDKILHNVLNPKKENIIEQYMKPIYKQLEKLHNEKIQKIESLIN